MSIGSIERYIKSEKDPCVLYDGIRSRLDMMPEYPEDWEIKRLQRLADARYEELTTYVLLSDAIQTVMDKPDMTYDTKMALRKRLESLEKPDAVPNREAEWVREDQNSLYHCSGCGKVAPYDCQGDTIEYWPDLRFCYYCGASMGRGLDVSLDRKAD